VCSGCNLNKIVDHLDTSSNNTSPPSVTYRLKEKLSEVPMNVKPHSEKNFFDWERFLQSPYMVEEISR
jgi:hypothetical protein